MAMSIEEKKRKVSDYNRKYYRKHKDKLLKRGHKNYIKNKLKALEYTGGEPCHNMFCSQNVKYLHQIDFHHVITENKTGEFHALFKSYSWERCKEEIDNCGAIPLCAMCHRDMGLVNPPIPLNTHEELE